MATETLSEYLERDITSECLSDIKQKVQDKYRYVSYCFKITPNMFFVHFSLLLLLLLKCWSLWNILFHMDSRHLPLEFIVMRCREVRRSVCCWFPTQLSTVFSRRARDSSEHERPLTVQTSCCFPVLWASRAKECKISRIIFQAFLASFVLARLTPCQIKSTEVF